MTALHRDLCNGLLFAPRVDDIAGGSVQWHNVIGTADSMEWNGNLKRLWIPSLRWSRMVSQYIDPVEFEAWIDAIKSRQKKYGSVVLRTNVVAPQVGGTSTVRNLGSCMLSLSYRNRPRRELVLHSRTCYLGYLSLLDLTVAHTAARHIAATVGCAVEEISFAWVLETAQYHDYRSTAWHLGANPTSRLWNHYWSSVHDATRDYMPGVWSSAKWIARMQEQDAAGNPYSAEKFVSRRRIRKRWHSEMWEPGHGNQFTDAADKAYAQPLPSVPTSSLDFSKIGIYLP